MLNIKTRAVAATGTLHLKDADGVPLFDGDKPVEIVLHGPGSKAYGVMQSRQTARAIKRMNDNEGKLSAGSADEQRLEQADDLADVTIAFNNFGYEDLQGSALFKAVYADPELGFIPPQVTKFLKDWGSFKAASSAS